ncbi:hypothetical protein BT96DRAFT_1010690 [Gymnopus androsaceus JB14]|uniref:Uncharacterized protein n=1 Tax=Gymnopus androsaceus JB14 TaxID=1447944 RepID=A0A6A4GAA8_9AGAR|nr:hypothetical protein BT96DRAFT_1010690 [Gymnopus androsaceus JB14]
MLCHPEPVAQKEYAGEDIVGEGKDRAGASASSAPMEDNEGVDPVIPPAAPVDEAQKAEGKENGPLGKAEAAAEKVTLEMYPEDVD